MAHEIFVDTSGFYALLVRRDDRHATAARALKAAARQRRKHVDQPWSFTDCLSFCVMKERRLRDALTKDVDFERAGFVALLK